MLAWYLKNSIFVNTFYYPNKLLMETKSLRRNSFSAIVMILFSTAISLISCQKDSNDTGSGTANTTIKVTDGAIDDASVTGAFVTITDIKLDGQSVQGFTKTTIDLNA